MQSSPVLFRLQSPLIREWTFSPMRWKLMSARRAQSSPQHFPRKPLRSAEPSFFVLTWMETIPMRERRCTLHPVWQAFPSTLLLLELTTAWLTSWELISTLLMEEPTPCCFRTKNSRSQKTYPRQVEKYCTIARLLGVQNFNTVTTIRALVAWVQFMLREMDIPLSISQTGKCTRAEYFKAIPDMAEAALQDACTPTNPRQPSKDDIMEIYERLW